MVEIELVSGKIGNNDNTMNVEMSKDEIWFLKTFVKEFNPKKIVEVGVSAGGNTVNLLQWKEKDAKLFSIDVAKQWYQDNSKLTGFMAEDSNNVENWKIYRGFDYLDVYDEIGGEIDFIIIDTVHFMPGEFLTFLAALPQLKDGCVVVLHDIHLNMLRLSSNDFSDSSIAAYCTGLLLGGISSKKKWSLKSNISNIGAFVVDESTRDNVKDIFRILCSAWYYFPLNLNLRNYLAYIHENYPEDCYNLFNTCLNLQAKYFDININKSAQTARVDILNSNKKNNAVTILETSDFVDVDFPEWFKTDNGSGAVIHSNEYCFDIKFKCINAGLLKINFMGPDVRNKFGNRIPSYVDYKNLSINGENIIDDKVTTWHNIPYIFKKRVRDGEIINVHVEWEQYGDTDDE